MCIKILTAPQCVALELYKIFCIQGPPQLLQSDNGKEFTDNMFKELLVLWPEVKIVHGRPRHPQSQGSCERANWDVAKMLRAWQHDRRKANKPTGFAIGLYEIQMKKNQRFHSTIENNPYKLVYGQDIINEVGDTLPINDDLFASMAIEEEATARAMQPDLNHNEQIELEKRYADLWLAQSGYTDMGFTPREDLDLAPQHLEGKNYHK